MLAKSINCEKGISPNPCLKCINCINIAYSSSIDVIEVDAASKSKIEDIREIIKHIKYRPLISKYKIFIIDEVHMLSIYSFNALLKILEEPPEHVIFVLATTNKKKIPKTILSRCLQFKLRKLHSREIINQLIYVLKSEKLNFDYQALRNISFFSNGSMRDALSILEQCIGTCDNIITYKETNKVLGLAGHELVIHLLTSISNKNVHAIYNILNKLSKSTDLKKVLNETIVVLHQIRSIKNSSNAKIAKNTLLNDNFVFQHNKLLQLSKIISLKDINIYYEIISNGLHNIDNTPTLQVGFEMIIFKMISYNSIKFNLHI